jgi:hypothetical protein
MILPNKPAPDASSGAVSPRTDWLMAPPTGEMAIRAVAAADRSAVAMNG